MIYLPEKSLGGGVSAFIPSDSVSLYAHAARRIQCLRCGLTRPPTHPETMETLPRHCAGGQS